MGLNVNNLEPASLLLGGVAFALLAYNLVCLWCFSILALAVVVWAYSGLQVVARPAVISCGQGMHLCTCSEFYFAQRFWGVWFVVFCCGLFSPTVPSQ